MKAKKSIGIRVTPATIFFSIVSLENDGVEVKTIDIVKSPKSMQTPEQLKFIRNTLSDIINEYQVNYACIRITESNARKVSIPRVYIEGVIQELFASSTIEKYYIGQISNIASHLGISRNEFKPYAEGDVDFEGIDDWKDLKLEHRESIMAAISALSI
ncbi:hypothetical protein QE382_004358 [Sphingobacterium zeae]|uniref:Uncharacterized protein n=1 Tax=Sphingobacterium zeae TaxID=1776859 RepID=A0ABU0UC07_9SPHI|nr:hypothetical protein [Sphingobacterium zeae]MDQ1152374.1 hypothetical protein [Sphingobacterium zeae]